MNLFAMILLINLMPVARADTCGICDADDTSEQKNCSELVPDDHEWHGSKCEFKCVERNEGTADKPKNRWFPICTCDEGYYKEVPTGVGGINKEFKILTCDDYASGCSAINCRREGGPFDPDKGKKKGGYANEHACLSNSSGCKGAQKKFGDKKPEDFHTVCCYKRARIRESFPLEYNPGLGDIH